MLLVLGPGDLFDALWSAVQTSSGVDQGVVSPDTGSLLVNVTPYR